MNRNGGEALSLSEGSEEGSFICSDAAPPGDPFSHSDFLGLTSREEAGGALSVVEAQDAGPDPESAEQVRAAREDAARRRRAELTEKGQVELLGEVMPEEESPLSRVARVVMPMGRLSRRVVAVLALLGGVGAMLLLGMGSDQRRATRTVAAMAGSTREEDGERGIISAGETIAHDETLRSTQDDRYRSRQTVFSSRPELVDEGRTVGADHTAAAAAPSVAAAPVLRVPTPEPAGRERGDYAVLMRAGETKDRSPASSAQTARENVETKSPEASITRGLRAGTRIPMTLLEPLQSGMATTVEARVDADVRDSDGMLLERGVRLTLPFPGIQTNGRMPCGSDPFTVPLADGRNLVFVAAVKGPDSLPGLPGKLTRTGSGSRLIKVARGMGRTAGGAARGLLGRTTGGYGVYTGDIGIDEAVAERYERAPKEVVTVPASLQFTLILREAAYLSK